WTSTPQRSHGAYISAGGSSAPAGAAGGDSCGPGTGYGVPQRGQRTVRPANCGFTRSCRPQTVQSSRTCIAVLRDAPRLLVQQRQQPLPQVLLDRLVQDLRQRPVR